MVYTIFLKGVNVGGRHKVKMAELRKHLETLGYRDVSSYIQSGNLLIRSESPLPETAETELEEQISKYTGFQVPLFLNPVPILDKILKNLPFGPDHSDEQGNRTFFTFIRSPDIAEKENAAMKELKKFVKGQEKLVYSEKGLWLFCPEDYGKTRLSNSLIENKLKCTATTRNLKTLKRMAEMAREIDNHG